MRRRTPFQQRDITRALKATKAAGHVASRVEIYGDGKLVVVLNGDDEPSESNDDWDKALANDR